MILCGWKWWGPVLGGEKRASPLMMAAAAEISHRRGNGGRLIEKQGHKGLGPAFSIQNVLRRLKSWGAQIFNEGSPT